MAWSDTTRKAETNTTSATNPLTYALNSTAAGSTIVVGVSAFSTSVTVSVSDNVNGSYTSAVEKAQGQTRCGIWFFKNNAGGNLTISVSRSPAADTSTWAHEFAGGGASVAVSGSTSTGGDTSWAAGDGPGNITPPDNDVLGLAACMVNFNGSIIENASGTTGTWTLSNEFENAGGQPGALVFRIFSGAPGTITHQWTLVSGREWSAVICALKPQPSTPTYTQAKFRVYADDSAGGLGEPA